MFAASQWLLSNSEPFVTGALSMFRNYDGQNATFGDTSVSATTSNAFESSIYASIDSNDPSDMVLVAINKTNSALPTTINLKRIGAGATATLYTLTSASSTPQSAGQMIISDPSAFAYTMPAYSVTTIRIDLAGGSHPDLSRSLSVGGTNGVASIFKISSGGQYAANPVANVAPFPGFDASARATQADVNGDGFEDTILVTGPGMSIRVAVVSGADYSTILVAPFDPFGGNFTGGGFVTAGDIDLNGRAEFVVTPDLGGGPRVSIFSLTHGAIQLRANFFGIDDPNYRGGARPALGDVNEDGKPDLLVSAGFGGGPRVALFDGATVLSSQTKLVNDFFAFPEDAQTLRNGIFGALGDMNGDGFADLIFGGGPGGAPRIYILSGQMFVTGSSSLYSQPIANFFVAGNSLDRGGVRVVAKNADDDENADLVVGSGEGSPAKVRVYLGKNFTTNGEPSLIQDLAAFGGLSLADGLYVG